MIYVIIGDNTTVKNAMIEKSVIGSNCTIGGVLRSEKECYYE